MSTSKPVSLVVHGWTVFAHPLFLAQLEALAQQVEAFEQKFPVEYVKKNATKRLAAITRLAFDVIPQDPARRNTGRATPSVTTQQALVQQPSSSSSTACSTVTTHRTKVIVFAWVNDEGTKRASESSDDAYRVFRKMLESGHPPDDWDQLLAEACAEGDRLQRFAAAAKRAVGPPSFPCFFSPITQSGMQLFQPNFLTTIASSETPERAASTANARCRRLSTRMLNAPRDIPPRRSHRNGQPLVLIGTSTRLPTR
ncbi:MAG: type II toxin-antitoxin system YhaV family toxin [Desulfurivibrio sp.]|nr:type II toxin-antitoxin system YhaV family toxin [Desulfurivibrio sp.]